MGGVRLLVIHTPTNRHDINYTAIISEKGEILYCMLGYQRSIKLLRARDRIKIDFLWVVWDITVTTCNLHSIIKSLLFQDDISYQTPSDSLWLDSNIY